MILHADEFPAVCSILVYQQIKRGCRRFRGAIPGHRRVKTNRFVLHRKELPALSSSSSSCQTTHKRLRCRGCINVLSAVAPGSFADEKPERPGRRSPPLFEAETRDALQLRCESRRVRHRLRLTAGFRRATYGVLMEACGRDQPRLAPKEQPPRKLSGKRDRAKTALWKAAAALASHRRGRPVFFCAIALWAT